MARSASLKIWRAGGRSPAERIELRWPVRCGVGVTAEIRRGCRGIVTALVQTEAGVPGFVKRGLVTLLAYHLPSCWKTTLALAFDDVGQFLCTTARRGKVDPVETTSSARTELTGEPLSHYQASVRIGRGPGGELASADRQRAIDLG